MKINYKLHFSLFILVLLILSCKSDKKGLPQTTDKKINTVKHANGFTIETNSNYTIVKVSEPWPGATKTYTYAFIPEDKLAVISYPKDAYDAVITTPIKNFIATSTTHIPAIESLGGLEKLIGFPNTKYISSMPARDRIRKGAIKEIGNNENLNTEVILSLMPDAIVGFGIDNQNNTYDLLQKATIPVIFNGDWAEKTPLGKAEWVKFFGVLLNKEKEADSIFNHIENEYLKVKALTKKATNKPTILCGALYKDVWYVPGGESWAAQFLKDANTDYIWQNDDNVGSLSLSIETVLEKGINADFWISPSQFTSYDEIKNANSHYLQFDAFKNKKIYTFANTKGVTGGLLYYELGPHRPDLILKDLVHIFHPNILPDYNPYFFTPLD